MKPNNDDLISRAEAIDELVRWGKIPDYNECELNMIGCVIGMLSALSSAQPTLYGYNVKHLELIARVLQKENIPPEMVAEALTDTGRIVAIIYDDMYEVKDEG